MLRTAVWQLFLCLLLGDYFCVQFYVFEVSQTVLSQALIQNSFCFFINVTLRKKILLILIKSVLEIFFFFHVSLITCVLSLVGTRDIFGTEEKSYVLIFKRLLLVLENVDGNSYSKICFFPPAKISENNYCAAHFSKL